MILQSTRVYIDEKYQPVQLVIQDGKIERIQEYGKEPVDRDYGNHRIIPGLIEMHAHGYNGMDVNYATYEGLKYWFKELPKEGVTSILPTSSTAPLKNLLESFDLITKVMDEGTEGVNILGIHTEGQFISFSHKGAHNPYLIEKPSVEEFKQWQEAAKNRIRLVTIAPEMDVDHELIKYCRSQGIHVTLGHTGAKYDECVQAYKDGAESFTHTFNGMRGIHHREPGVAGAALSNDDMYAELICDGVHVHFAVAKMVARCKGKDKLILITDAVQIKGLKPGVYNMPGRWVQIGEDGCGRLKDGTLAGSSNKLIKMVRNLVKECGIDEITAINAATKNIATFLEIERKGSIKENYDADIIVIDDEYQVLQTYIGGVEKL